jgi:hypothetical protein
LHASLAARYSLEARQVQTKPLVSPRVAIATRAASIIGKTPKKKESFFNIPPTHPEINISAAVQVFI